MKMESIKELLLQVNLMNKQLQHIEERLNSYEKQAPTISELCMATQITKTVLKQYAELDIWINDLLILLEGDSNRSD